MTRRALLVGAAALAGAACAPDPHDVYTVDEVAPATRAPDLAASMPTDGASGQDAPATFPPNGETVEVRALDNSFRAETIEIVAGTEVRWINGGRSDHDVLPVDDADGYGVEREDFAPGDEYRHVFDTPGVYPYHCSIHGTEDVGMIGTVIVTAP